MMLGFLSKLLNLSKPDWTDPVRGLFDFIQDDEYLPTSTPCPTPASTPMSVSWSWAGTRSDPTFSLPASGSWFLPLSASGSWLFPLPTPGSWLLPLSAPTTMTPEIQVHKFVVTYREHNKLIMSKKQCFLPQFKILFNSLKSTAEPNYF